MTSKSKIVSKASWAKRDEDFWNDTQTSAISKSGNELIIVSGVSGVSNEMTFLDLNLISGHCCAGYFDEKENGDKVLRVFGTNEKVMTKPVKDLLDAWGSSHDPFFTSFEKPELTPIKVAAKAPRKLDLTTVTGTYERSKKSRFASSTLSVLALPGAKIKFNIEASNGGRTGGVSTDTAKIVNNRAVYEYNGARIVLAFHGNSVSISGNDSSLCGSGVTLPGDYLKTDDKPPEF
jgi:hypothetical protein